MTDIFELDGDDYASIMEDALMAKVDKEAGVTITNTNFGTIKPYLNYGDEYGTRVGTCIEELVYKIYIPTHTLEQAKTRQKELLDNGKPKVQPYPIVVPESYCKSYIAALCRLGLIPAPNDYPVEAAYQVKPSLGIAFISSDVGGQEQIHAQILAQQLQDAQ